MTHASPFITDMMCAVSRKLFNAAQAGDADLCEAVLRQSRDTIDFYIIALEEKRHAAGN